MTRSPGCSPDASLDALVGELRRARSTNQQIKEELRRAQRRALRSSDVCTPASAPAPAQLPPSCTSSPAQPDRLPLSSRSALASELAAHTHEALAQYRERRLQRILQETEAIRSGSSAVRGTPQWRSDSDSGPATARGYTTSAPTGVGRAAAQRPDREAGRSGPIPRGTAPRPSPRPDSAAAPTPAEPPSQQPASGAAAGTETPTRQRWAATPESRDTARAPAQAGVRSRSATAAVRSSSATLRTRPSSASAAVTPRGAVRPQRQTARSADRRVSPFNSRSVPRSDASAGSKTPREQSKAVWRPPPQWEARKASPPPRMGVLLASPSAEAVTSPAPCPATPPVPACSPAYAWGPQPSGVPPTRNRTAVPSPARRCLHHASASPPASRRSRTQPQVQEVKPHRQERRRKEEAGARHTTPVSRVHLTLPLAELARQDQRPSTARRQAPATARVAGEKGRYRGSGLKVPLTSRQLERAGRPEGLGAALQRIDLLNGDWETRSEASEARHRLRSWFESQKNAAECKVPPVLPIGVSWSEKASSVSPSEQSSPAWQDRRQRPQMCAAVR